MSLVYWDSMLFIYWLESHPTCGPLVEAIIHKMGQRGDQLCTTVFTVGEVLVGPYAKGRLNEVKRFSEYFDSGDVTVLPFDRDAVERYSQIRGQYRVSPADGIHLATASVAHVDVYLTNDNKVKKLLIDGIKFIAGLDGNIF